MGNKSSLTAVRVASFPASPKRTTVLGRELPKFIDRNLQSRFIRREVKWGSVASFLDLAPAQYGPIGYYAIPEDVFEISKGIDSITDFTHVFYHSNLEDLLKLNEQQERAYVILMCCFNIDGIDASSYRSDHPHGEHANTIIIGDASSVAKFGYLKKDYIIGDASSVAIFGYLKKDTTVPYLKFDVYMYKEEGVKDEKQLLSEWKITRKSAKRDWPSCMDDWKIGELLGEGTVGKVYRVFRGGTVAAAKIQILKNAIEVDRFKREVQNQEAFGRYAPEIYLDCVEKRDKNTSFGVIIMELIEIELDNWLSTPRDSTELAHLVEDISSIGKYCMKRKLTHGDLALFNIARTHSGRWVFIDFDRASTTVFRPEVDIYRLQLEIQSPPKDRSMNSKPLNSANVKWLRKNAIAPWQAAWKQPNAFNSSQVSVEWENAYEDYCVAANIKCLE